VSEGAIDGAERAAGGNRTETGLEATITYSQRQSGGWRDCLLRGAVAGDAAPSNHL